MVSKKFISNIIQIVLWTFGLIYPSVIFYYFTGSGNDAVNVFKTSLKLLSPMYVSYFVNFWIFVPRLLFRDRKKLFYGLNALLLACIAEPMFFAMRSGTLLPEVDPQAAKYLKASLWGIYAGYLIICVTFMLLAVGVRYIQRWNEDRHKLEEERRRNAEAELNWLKNQLNPHFLFNTLNNISSLIQVDAEKAQDSIAQLSDLLRYALYESNSRKVKVADEVEFMRNYIELMSLRCSGKTSLNVRFDAFDPDLTISPLMFISLIENAFKHGTSAHNESVISVDMGMDGDDMVFSCVNALIERHSADYSGPGVGLENMKRRLELLYPGRYSYEQSAEEGMYVAVVRIKNIAGYEQDQMHYSR